jgi:hypothetical protein
VDLGPLFSSLSQDLEGAISRLGSGAANTCGPVLIGKRGDKSSLGVRKYLLANYRWQIWLIVNAIGHP